MLCDRSCEIFFSSSLCIIFLKKLCIIPWKGTKKQRKKKLARKERKTCHWDSRRKMPIMFEVVQRLFSLNKISIWSRALLMEKVNDLEIKFHLSINQLNSNLNQEEPGRKKGQEITALHSVEIMRKLNMKIRATKKDKARSTLSYAFPFSLKLFTPFGHCLVTLPASFNIRSVS